jgi:hypothetical protein
MEVAEPMSEIFVTKVEYVVAAVPIEDERHPYVRLTVGLHWDRMSVNVRTGWTVERDGRNGALNRDGGWDYVPRPSEQDEEWQAAHWFDEAEAIRLAEQEAPDLLERYESTTQARERRRSERAAAGEPGPAAADPGRGN